MRRIDIPAECRSCDFEAASDADEMANTICTVYYGKETSWPLPKPFYCRALAVFVAETPEELAALKALGEGRA